MISIQCYYLVSPNLGPIDYKFILSGNLHTSSRVCRRARHLQGQLLDSQARQEQLPLEQLSRRLHSWHVPVLPGASTLQSTPLEERHNRRNDSVGRMDRSVTIRRTREQDDEGHPPSRQHQGVRLPPWNHLPHVCRQVREPDGTWGDVPMLLQQGQPLDRTGVLWLHRVPGLNHSCNLNSKWTVWNCSNSFTLLVLSLLPGQVQEVWRTDQHGRKRGVVRPWKIIFNIQFVQSQFKPGVGILSSLLVLFSYYSLREPHLIVQVDHSK